MPEATSSGSAAPAASTRSSRTSPIRKAKEAWLKLEQASGGLIYTLLALGLPVEPRTEAAERVGVRLQAGSSRRGEGLIGHERGLITINIAEADSPFREKTRIALGETYRTVLGHFRHEIGHYYWDRLVAGSPCLEPFRELFGDERASYDEAVAAHYRDGAPADWPTRFVSSYASMHPWEDWAESWAHYLHMVDTLETARSFGWHASDVTAARSGADELEVAPGGSTSTTSTI